jgi:hypothetical protein
VVDEATTVKLLSSYGRQEDLVYFAGLKGDHETVPKPYRPPADPR